MSIHTTFERATNAEIVQILKKLRKEIKWASTLPESSMPQFRQISLILSKSLPKLSDSSLLEIDKFLYQDYSEDDASTDAGFDSNEPNMVLSTDCTRLYMETYRFLGCLETSENAKLDATYLQMLEHSPDEYYNDESCVRDVLSCVEDLMHLKSANKLCLSLKILRIALMKNRKFVRDAIEFSMHFNRIVLWMLKVQNIPDGRLPKQKRISFWLRHQCRTIIQTIDLKTFNFSKRVREYLDVFTCKQDDNYVMVEQEFNIEFIRNWKSSDSWVPFSVDLIHSYFMSAKNEDQKIKRLKDFLLGISLYNMSEIKMSENSSLKLLTSKVVDQCQFIGVSDEYFYLFDNRVYSDNTLKDMEKIYGCEIKPYLSGDKNKAYDIVIDESKLDQKEEETSNSIQNSEDEHDYTIEKFLFYDEFVKRLQVLNVVHTACMMCQELLKTEEDIIGLDSKIFRHFSYYINNHLSKVRIDPLKRGHIPWPIKILLMKCPFVILSKRHEYLLDDLIKMLKGEEVDELVEEELYFLLNPTENIESEKEDYDEEDDD